MRSSGNHYHLHPLIGSDQQLRSHVAQQLLPPGGGNPPRQGTGSLVAAAKMPPGGLHCFVSLTSKEKHTTLPGFCIFYSKQPEG